MLNRTLRYIITIVTVVLVFGTAAVAVIAGRNSRKPLVCKSLDVVIVDSLENDFVNKADVKRFLDKEYGGYIGTVLDSIDLCRIETIIDGRSAVMKSQAFVTKDGTLHIKVTQRKPIVRFQKSDGGFYADTEGYVFPLQSSYASYVQIIDGDIPINMKSGHKGEIENPEEKIWFDKVMKLVNFIEGSPWKERIVQIHVGNGGELTLIPREGEEKFIIGQPMNIEDKFARIEKYYTAIAPLERNYKTINLIFDGQIVCR
jgi:cell division protein FtsQ